MSRDIDVLPRHGCFDSHEDEVSRMERFALSSLKARTNTWQKLTARSSQVMKRTFCFFIDFCPEQR